MDQRTKQQPWEGLRDLAAAEDVSGLTAFIGSLSPSEALRAILVGPH